MKSEVERLIARIEHMGYGDTITHSEISMLIDAEKSSKKYAATIASAKTYLEQAGKAIENIRGIGYRVMRPDTQYPDASCNYVKHALNRIKKAKKVVDYAPVNDMSPEARMRCIGVQDGLSRTLAFMAGKKTELNLINRQHPFLASKQ